ncbi:hypothetical protein PHLGIDRAFT_437565 [Phlebiopsis gigantea 11061_1 CR5-6]|uniref:Uncharacterized protein n=1 Tax=Phlebiopsis gigantea (strain 11061_1 CR5-6) TaxID=745531 RepID=A0A0C3SF96_PHLG1|nr:hypothetical protein PHLGIDRAFT_437565 [Phlebiopsis gigantea 11061_1 CR5-6]
MKKTGRGSLEVIRFHLASVPPPPQPYKPRAQAFARAVLPRTLPSMARASVQARIHRCSSASRCVPCTDKTLVAKRPRLGSVFSLRWPAGPALADAPLGRNGGTEGRRGGAGLGVGTTSSGSAGSGGGREEKASAKLSRPRSGSQQGPDRRVPAEHGCLLVWGGGGLRAATHAFRLRVVFVRVCGETLSCRAARPC